MTRRFVRSFRAFLVLTALIALICVCLGQEVPLSEMKISCVHLTLGEGPASMVVTWRSSLVTEDAVVKAWPAGLKTMPTSGKDLITGKLSQHTYKFARDTVNIYDAILGGLEPNAAYNYQISCGGATSPVNSFQSPVMDANTPFTFAVWVIAAATTRCSAN